MLAICDESNLTSELTVGYQTQRLECKPNFRIFNCFLFLFVAIDFSYFETLDFLLFLAWTWLSLDLTCWSLTITIFLPFSLNLVTPTFVLKWILKFESLPYFGICFKKIFYICFYIFKGKLNLILYLFLHFQCLPEALPYGKSIITWSYVLAFL